MHHSYIDRLAYQDTVLGRRDPRAKVACALALVLALVLVPEGRFLALGLLAGLVLGVAAASPVSLGYVLRRSLLVLPFAGAAALAVAFSRPGRPLAGLGPFQLTAQGLEAAASLLFKATVAAWVLLLLAATTRFDHLLAALRWYRLPGLFLEILSFLYRYLFLLVDEAQRMSRARAARSPGRVQRPWATAAAMITALAARSYERGQRVYLAMLARGYDGTPRPLTRLPRPWAWVLPEAVLALAALGLAAWGRMARLP